MAAIVVSPPTEAPPGHASAGAHAPRTPWLTIRRKIRLGFLVMSAITAALGGYAVVSIIAAGQLVVDTYDHSLMSISYARAAAGDFARMELARLAGTISADAGAALDDDLAIAAERAQSPRARDAAQAAGRAANAWAAADADPVTLSRSAAEVDRQLDLLINYTAGDGFQYRQRALAAVASSTQLAVGATIAALLLTGVVTTLLSRRIMGPLAAASAAAGRIAAGQLDTPIPRTGNDELGALLSAMAVMRDNIRAMVQSEVAQRRSAQGLLVDAIESSREGVALLAPDGRVLMANARCKAVMAPIAARLAPGLTFAAALDAAGEGQEVALADGSWLHVGRSVTRDGGAVVIVSDITTLKRQQSALEETNQRFDAALNTMSQGLCLFDATGTLRVVNRRFAEIFLLEPGSVLPGLPVREVIARAAAAAGVAPPLSDAILSEREGRLCGGSPGLEFREFPGERVIAINTQPMPDGGTLVTYEDVSERRQAEARAEFLAHNDALTGLPNRLLFRDTLREMCARPAGVGVFRINLDHFKTVNDTLGDVAADLLLRAVGRRLADGAIEGDLVARLGGDEFAVASPAAAQPDGAAALAARIVAALAEPFEIGGRAVLTAASVGIATAPADSEDADTLLSHADTALLRAKQEGRATYRFFEAAMDAKLKARRALEADLRQALAREEFEVWYQPLMDLAKDRVSGCEALVRWRHPVRGMVSPAEFIPVVEEIGLIGALGAFVLRAATAQAAAWPDHVKIAVNVSPLQFKEPRLVEIVAEALARSGLRPGRLELEITESVLLTDSAGTLAMLHRLHALGARIAMDDFGTGYSSLSYLRSFPFDKIKIDQSFIRDLSGTGDAAAIVRAVLGLGATLGMRTTAEGVETAAQLAQLRAEGCDEVQGYIFSKPRPASELAALIARLDQGALAEV